MSNDKKILKILIQFGFLSVFQEKIQISNILFRNNFLKNIYLLCE